MPKMPRQRRYIAAVIGAVIAIAIGSIATTSVWQKRAKVLKSGASSRVDGKDCGGIDGHDFDCFIVLLMDTEFGGKAMNTKDQVPDALRAGVLSSTAPRLAEACWDHAHPDLSGFAVGERL